MAKVEVPDPLWERIQPLLPVVPRRRRWPGRRRINDRAWLNGILFVLLTGINWTDLPTQLGYGSGVTCSPAAARLAAGRRLGPPA